MSKSPCNYRLSNVLHGSRQVNTILGFSAVEVMPDGTGGGGGGGGGGCMALLCTKGLSRLFSRLTREVEGVSF